MSYVVHFSDCVMPLASLIYICNVELVWSGWKLMSDKYGCTLKQYLG